MTDIGLVLLFAGIILLAAGLAYSHRGMIIVGCSALMVGFSMMLIANNRSWVVAVLVGLLLSSGLLRMATSSKNPF